MKISKHDNQHSDDEQSATTLESDNATREIESDLTMVITVTIVLGKIKAKW